MKWLSLLASTYSGIVYVGDARYSGPAINTAQDFDISGIALQENDIVVSMVAVTGSIVGNATGYTTIATAIGQDTMRIDVRAQYKIMGSTPDTSINVSTSATGQAYCLRVMAFRNADTSTPLDVAATISELSNTMIPNPPSITPVTRGSLILVCGACSGVQSFSTSGLDQFASQSGVGSSAQASLGSGFLYSDASAYDHPAFSISNTDRTDRGSAAITLALRAS